MGGFVADCCKSGKGEYPTAGFKYSVAGVEFHSSLLQYDDAGSVLRVIADDDNFSPPVTA